MATTVDLATLAEMLLERLDSRWRRPDLTFSINVVQDTIVLSIAAAERLRKYRYDLAAAILRSADRFSNVVAA
jgi:hypothetical protein